MGPHRLRLLAVSDTHLGEETSLLSFPRGLQHVWTTLREDPAFWKPVFPDFKKGDKVVVDELVLVGDIPDRTLSSTSQISGHSHALAMMLGDALDVRKVVYVPGNHDHTLWTGYAQGSSRRREVFQRGDASPRITSAEGERLVEGGRCLDESAEEILSIFFGYPIGWAWWEIRDDHDFDFTIANPVYATTIGERTYAFAHGTHFREELVSAWRKGFLRLFDRTGIDRLLRLELELGGDLTDAENLDELEDMVTPFVDSLWPSSKNAPTSRSDELWYLFTLLRETSATDGRAMPPRSEAFPAESLHRTPENRINRLTDEDGEPRHGSLERFRDHFLRHLLTHLDRANLVRDDLAFIYGDTHSGGWGTLAPGGSSPLRDKPIDVYNCGTWVVDSPERHPACHLFAVDDEGNDYLLDVAFGEGVMVGDDSLLRLAARDAEHRLEVVSTPVRAFGEGLKFLRESLGEGLPFLRNLR